MNFILGKDCKLYLGTTGTVLASLTEVTAVRKGSLNIEATKIDKTTRANGGWKSTAAGLREATIEIEVVFDPEDAQIAALIAAALPGGPLVAAAALTGEKSTAGTMGLHGEWAVTQNNRSEDLDETVPLSFTLSLDTFVAWVDVAGSGSGS